MSAVPTESGDRHSPSRAWITGVLRRRPVGVVLVFADLAAEAKATFQSHTISFVIIDPASNPAPDVPPVGSANWSGGLVATRHLNELGHTRIAAITGRDDMIGSFARVDGYRSAMTSAGIEIDERFVRFGNFQVDGGRSIALELLTLPNPPTAIFAGSDFQSLGVTEAARTLGLRVLVDLSIVGDDDLQHAQWSSPALTTVHQPLTAMAEEAARLVIRMSKSTLETIPRMDLATRLVVRESTAAPAAG